MTDTVNGYRVGSGDRRDLPVAVVIGAGGLGMAAARRLGQQNRILLASLIQEENRQRVAELRADGIDASAIQCDITDPASVAAMAAHARELGPLRTLAHVAALSPAMGDWRSVMRVNAIGATLVERALLPLAGDQTAAIFISSLAAHGVQPFPETAEILRHPLAPDFLDRLEAAQPDIDSGTAYRLSKWALNRMVERRAADWGRQGARIVSLSPGLIATPMGALEFQGPNRQGKLGLLARTPICREGSMMEIADALEFLASSRASFISGTDLRVDGGIFAAMQNAPD